MSDAAGQQGSRLEVAPVLTVGHALLYPRVGYEPIGTLCIFVHSVVHR
jgi:predicted N-acetyltransferase YhbS